MIGALLGTLSIFLFHMILVVALTGLGLALRRAFGLAQATLEDCFLAFWMGFVLVILFLMLWNFAFPVRPAALGIVLVTGMAGMVGARRCLTTGLRESVPPPWSVICTVLFSLWVSNLSLGQLTAWDSALYHIQGVKWAINYPVVPGLANVFGPMGYNNSSFLYDALLNVGPWSGSAWHVSNGLLVSAFGAQIITGAARLLDRSAATSSAPIFSLLLVPAAVDSAQGGRVSSFMTSVPASLVLMIAALLGFRAFSDQGQHDRERAYDLFCAVALGAVAVSIKTSAAVFAAAILFVSCFGILRLGRADGRRVRTLAWSLVAVAAIGGTWAARGVILSGYPFFPSPVLSLPVDWRLPAEHVRAEFDFVVHSSRATAENFAFVSGETEGIGVWLPRWARITRREDPYEVVVPAVMAAIAAFSFLWSKQRATPAEQEAVRAGWLMLIPPGFALAAWFAVAPMPSYGAPFFWSVAAVMGSQAFRLRPRSTVLTRGLLVVGFGLGVTPALIVPISSSPQSPPGILFTRIVESNIRLPDSGQWYQDNETEPRLTVYTTRTGLVLNVPIGPAGRCWDAPLPCTPNPAPNLRLRVPGSIERGFAVDGAWQMLDWPEPWRGEFLPALREGWGKADGLR